MNGIFLMLVCVCVQNEKTSMFQKKRKKENELNMLIS